MVIGDRGHAPPVPPLPGEHVASLSGPGKDVVRGIKAQVVPGAPRGRLLLPGHELLLRGRGARAHRPCPDRGRGLGSTVVCSTNLVIQ